MNLLEMFSGTGSVGLVAKAMRFNVISLGFEKNADLNTDILKWDYRQFDRNHFSCIWASPPCTEYSKAKTTGVRKIEHANAIGLRTLEIIDDFKPEYWFLENPQTNLLQEQEFMKGLPFYDVDYCKYGMPYRKRTRIWTNLTTWKPRPLCKRDCGNVRNGKHIETAQRLPSGTRELWGDNYIKHKQEDLYKILKILSVIF